MGLMHSRCYVFFILAYSVLVKQQLCNFGCALDVQPFFSPNERRVTDRTDDFFSCVWHKWTFQGMERFFILLNNKGNLHEPQHGNVGIAKRLLPLSLHKLMGLFSFFFSFFLQKKTKLIRQDER